MEKYLTKKELAEKLNVTIGNINNRMVEGLPYIKIGKSVRFNYEEVLKWLKGGKNERD